MGSKEDHLRQPFHFVCVFQECPSVSVCVYSVCAFCHLVQCFSLIPRIGQAEITPQGLVLKHFKDFCRVTEDSSLVVLPCKLIIFCRNEWPVYKVAWPEVYHRVAIPGVEAPCLDETFFVMGFAT